MGFELEYSLIGSGDPVVLIHAGVCADWFKPLLSERVLTDSFLVLSYHRVGYGRSSRLEGSVSIADQANHCSLLMRQLGIGRAHIVGHSSSANMALQLALDLPNMVHSLALLEPALYQGVPSASGAARAFVKQASELYQAGDKAGAVDVFMRGVCGPNYRTVLDSVLPGAFDQAVDDADAFFQQELRALREWSFGLEDAKRITQPALDVIGEESQNVSVIWRERQEVLLAWLPNVEPLVLPKTTHLLQLQNPGGMAEGLAAFFARHALS